MAEDERIADMNSIFILFLRREYILLDQTDLFAPEGGVSRVEKDEIVHYTWIFIYRDKDAIEGGGRCSPTRPSHYG